MSKVIRKREKREREGDRQADRQIDRMIDRDRRRRHIERESLY